MVQSISLDQQPRALGGNIEGMEVRVFNFPENLNFRSLKEFVKPHLQKLSIRAVDYVKSYNKKYASMTFLHAQEAHNFLLHHGQIRAQSTRRPVPMDQATYINLKFNGRPVYFEQSRYPADPITLRCLRREQSERAVASTRRPSDTLPINFVTSSVSCGLFDYGNQDLFFSPQTTWQTGGIAQFGTRSMILRLDNDLRIDFRYSAVLGIVTEGHPDPCLTVYMHEAPRFYQKISDNPALEIMGVLFDGMDIRNTATSTPLSRQKSGPTRTRLPGLDLEHQKIAGNCLVYRIELRKVLGFDRHGLQEDVQGLIERLKKAHDVPSTIYQPTDVVHPIQLFSEAFRLLLLKLSSLELKLPISIKFQVQRLAQNNCLHPAKVLQLLPEIEDMQERNPGKTAVCVAAIQKLYRQIHFSGPDAKSDDFVLAKLVTLLKENETELLKEEFPADMVPNSSDNVAIIHRARITPTGLYLQGPARETKNRVLRKYPNHHDYFLRVQFCDEDGASVMFSPRVNNYRVYHERFKDVLEKGIEIAGQIYTFLGFSHSSLRAQSCWFVAPFVFNSMLLYDRMIIEDLGDFTMIRTPAKCAARIGQTFSETPTALHIDAVTVNNIPDVSYGDRIFSDGVGTISTSLLSKVWDKLPAAKLIKPTCLQIRYRGAKGMISLDSRLSGDVLRLRDSMIKFEGSTSNDLEICESAYKPLPMYLNRQIIKILEDLGVEDRFFLDLQAKEIEKLRMITATPINASTFLKRQSIGTAIHLPWLINKLAMMDLNFKDDGFLRDVLEVAIVTELRMLKHKTRILVEKGWHLHGLMDETGFLKEGEVFCCIIEDGVPQVLVENDVIISRAPALHPGDVQLANAVMPPPGSPLMNITNCICFSQHGVRDLPSQLSGGDLDGDRYYIMYDKNARLKRTVAAADYPRLPPIDIGRPVERSDMTDFFLHFMESDQLGRIAVAHRVLADQKEEGTLHPDCLLLADLHSTAVDFSKTGRAVDTSRIPWMNKFRPDFEAPGPHVHIEKLDRLAFTERVYVDPNEQIEEDDDFTTYRYYESDKILGQLYRAIDEREIFTQIQARASSFVTSQSNVIEAVWNIVQNECRLIQWGHLRETAWEIRRIYEGCLSNNMINYSQHPRRPLSELEAFIGSILGQSNMPSRQERDSAKSMKEKFGEDSLYIVNLIVKDGDGWHRESLERSMACLAVSLEDSEPGHKDSEHLSSFKYLAAAVCLREVKMLALPQDLPEFVPTYFQED